MTTQTDPPATGRRGAVGPTRARTAPSQRLPREERRAQILAKAYQYFSEHGLNAQTRALAASCGVSQRLLYSFFPSKAALIDEVYRSEIAGSFKAIWFVELKDRDVPLEARLVRFYRDYFETVTTRRWLRMFLHASLDDVAMAPAYIATIVTHTLEIVVAEAAHAQQLEAPTEAARMQEIGWILHGAVSHLAIRRHVYGNTNPVPTDEVVTLQVRVFLAGLSAVLPAARDRR